MVAVDISDPSDADNADQAKALCRVDAIPDAGAIEVEHEGDSFVVIRYGASVTAYLNVCPHAGRSLNWAPGRFLLSHGQLVCAAHGASFKPETGECIGGPCRGQSLRRLSVRIEGDWVWADRAN